MYSLPDPEPNIDKQEPPHRPWSFVDLVVFALFFGMTFIVIPLATREIARIFNPQFELTDLTAVDQVLLQGVMNLVLLGFIAFLVKVVHRLSFRDTIHWFRNYEFNNGFLIALGAMLAVSVLIVSSFFPPKEAPPIEKLLTSTLAVWVFAIFGTLLAPLFEEIMFRGFLFKVLHDIGGPAAAVTVTALVFALLHLPQLWGSWAGIALIFAVGYILSWVRQRSNSLIPSFIIHTSYNAMLFGLFALSTFVEKGAS
jgi:membrane protease YdiL (CAAX protease family)